MNCLMRPKINGKEAVDGPLLLKHYFKPWLVGICKAKAEN